MAELKLVYYAITGQLGAALERMREPIAIAATGAIKAAGEQMKTQGRANIGAAGFSKKWQNAYRVTVYPKSGVALDPAVWAYHKIPYAGVFETGATIAGKPLLWLPIKAIPQKIGRQRMTPKLYEQQVGPLTSLRVPGKKPMLAGPVNLAGAGPNLTLARLRTGAQRKTGKGIATIPLFVGIAQVHEPAKFGLDRVLHTAAAGLGAGYLAHLPK